MGCNQSSSTTQDILNIDLSEMNIQEKKSEIAKKIIIQYDDILIELQQRRRQITQITKYPLNKYILGEYKSDKHIITQYTKKYKINLDLNIQNELNDILKTLKSLSKKYTSLKNYILSIFDSSDETSDYYLQIQWKDEVLLKYFTIHIDLIESNNSQLSTPIHKDLSPNHVQTSNHLNIQQQTQNKTYDLNHFCVLPNNNHNHNNYVLNTGSNTTTNSTRNTISLSPNQQDSSFQNIIKSSFF